MEYSIHVYLYWDTLYYIYRAHCITYIGHRAHCITYILCSPLRFEHSLDWVESLLGDVHYLHYASLTARSLSTLVTPQCNPTMCNRTSCAQVQELPQSHCGDNREGTLYYIYIYIYIYI